MKELLNTFSIPLLIEVIFHPLVELTKEIDAISLDRHKIRSIVKIIFTIIISISAIYFAINNPAVNQFFIKITDIFNVSQGSQAFVSEFLEIISSCHLGNYIANITIRTFCRFYFGDPEFYLTPKQLIKLEKKFKEQVNYEIQDKHIIEVIDFCIKNLRKQDSRDIGAKKEDWKNTLESLIYEADAEHFLDQQKALYLKRQIIEHKLQTLIEYTNKNYSYCAHEYQFNKPSPTNSTLTYGSINSPSNAENTNYPKNQHKKKLQQRLDITKVYISEKTPLLDEKPILTNVISSDNIQNNVSPSNQRAKYKCLHITPPTTPPSQSNKSLLIEYQKNLLRKQELTTNQRILSAPFATQNSALKSSNESGISSSGSLDQTSCLQHKM